MTGIIKVDDIKDAGGNSIISSNGSGTLTYTFNAGSIAGAAIANDAIDSAHYADGSIDLAHMSVNSIDSDQYVAGSIDTAHIADNQVTLAKMAGIARGKIIYGDSSGDPAVLAVGSSGQALTTDGTDISWGSAGATLSGSTNNTVVTVTGANAMIGEATLTYDGTTLSNIPSGTNSNLRLQNSTTGSGSTDGLLIQATGNDVYFNNYENADIYFRTSNTDRLKIENDGKVGIGETTPLGLLHVKQSDSGTSSVNDPDGFQGVFEGSANSGITILSGTGNNGHVLFGDSGDNDIGRIVYRHADNSLAFDVGGVEEMRIVDSGGIKIGTSTADNSGLHVEKDIDGWFLEYLRNTSDTGSDTHMCYWHFVNVAHDNTTDDFLRARDSSTNRCKIKSDGDLQNHDNSYGSTSDERIKQDITDSGSQWDDVKAMRVRKYKKKDDVRQYGENAWEQIGLIAQELEAASMDKLVRENLPDSADVLSSSEFGVLYTEQDKTDGLIPTNNVVGDVKTVSSKVKSIGYSVVHMKALKALQEAQTRIETLEAKVAVLEG